MSILEMMTANVGGASRGDPSTMTNVALKNPTS